MATQGTWLVMDTFSVTVLAVLAVLLFQLVTTLIPTRRGVVANASDLPTRERSLHLLRKFQHCGTGLVFLALDVSETLTPEQERIIVSACAMVFYLVHLLRQRWAWLNQRLSHWLRGLLREDEASGQAVPAAFWFLLGVAQVLFLFPGRRHVFRVALLQLSVGDPAASLGGQLLGHTKWPLLRRPKTVEGSAVCFVTCALVMALYLATSCASLCTAGAPPVGMAAGCWVLVLGAGAIGAAAELVELPPIDDNFTMPVVASLGLAALDTFAVRWGPSACAS